MRVVMHEFSEYSYDKSSKVLIEFTGEDLHTLGIDLSRSYHNKCNPTPDATIVLTMKKMIADYVATVKAVINTGGLIGSVDRALQSIRDTLELHKKLIPPTYVDPASIEESVNAELRLRAS